MASLASDAIVKDGKRRIHSSIIIGTKLVRIRLHCGEISRASTCVVSRSGERGAALHPDKAHVEFTLINNSHEAIGCDGWIIHVRILIFWIWICKPTPCRG